MTRISFWFPLALIVALLGSQGLSADEQTRSIWKAREQCEVQCVPVLSKIPFINRLFRPVKPVHRAVQVRISRAKSNGTKIAKPEKCTSCIEWKTTTSEAKPQCCDSLILLKRFIKQKSKIAPKCCEVKISKKDCKCKENCSCGKICKCKAACDCSKKCECKTKCKCTTDDKCTKNCKCAPAACCETDCCPVVKSPRYSITLPVRVTKVISPVSRTVSTTKGKQQYLVELNLKRQTPSGLRALVNQVKLVTTEGRPAKLQVGDTEVELRIRYFGEVMSHCPFGDVKYSRPQIPFRTVVQPMAPAQRLFVAPPHAVLPPPIRPLTIHHPVPHPIVPQVALPHPPLPHPIPHYSPPCVNGSCPAGICSEVEVPGCCRMTSLVLESLVELLKAAAHSKREEVKARRANPLYLHHPPKYFPPSPAFPFEKELAAMEEACAVQQTKAVDVERVSTQVIIPGCDSLETQITPTGARLEGKGVRCKARKMQITENGQIILRGNAHLECVTRKCKMSIVADQVLLQLKGGNLKISVNETRLYNAQPVSTYKR